MPKIIGHRGAKGEYPENTLGGFKKAIEAGVGGIELDVHLTKDNELAVIHDEDVDRTTNGKGLVREMTLGQLKKFDAGNRERIPSLQGAISVIKHAGIFLAVEIKCRNAEQKVVEAIDSSGMTKDTIVKSFDHRIVRNLKKINPKIKTACLLVGLPVHAYKILGDANADAISINCDTVDKELIDECHKYGKEVFVWNIDDKKKLKKYSDMGADYIGTNFPSIVKL
ncbi:glycerophosphodiester phosphodiesterase [Candidatus Woesearchaeota archaeon]|nr:glycerophosphodiester phosphodiesterase [Candidatus Woesearchaeota archaeon]